MILLSLSKQKVKFVLWECGLYFLVFSNYLPGMLPSGRLLIHARDLIELIICGNDPSVLDEGILLRA